MEENKSVPEEERWPKKKGYEPPLYLDFDRMKPAPKIEIDSSKCTTPLDCRKCLLACPMAVFYVQPTKLIRGREQNPKAPGDYYCWARWRYACIGCGDCLRVCPVDAIRIDSPEGWHLYPEDIKGS